jgi:hypothetical protein
MRRTLLGFFGGKSDEKIDQATTQEPTNDVVDDYTDDTALGLDTWVEGVDPVVE